MNFHLPYHFVPATERKGAVSAADFKNGQPEHVTHDRYVEGKHSGRIVCRIETKTPIFVGSKRVEGTAPVRVEPYTLNGRPAIPASSLRGMTGSLVEAATNSAFRVLNTRARYSVRKRGMEGDSLSAIGMVHQRGGKYFLQPLCIPTLRADRDGCGVLPEEFRALFPEPNMRVYVGRPNTIRREDFPYRTFNNDKHYGLPLRYRSWLPGYRLEDDEFQHRKPLATRNFVLAQLPLVSGMDPAPWDRVQEKVPENLRGDCVPGVMRVLGCWGNRTDTMPTTKKHELFLPWPQRTDWPEVPIPDEAVEQFEAICDARKDASENHRPWLPFEPRGTRPLDQTNDRKDGEIRLQQGDLVYFGVDKATGRVNEISFSAIWRKAIAGTSGDFFPKELWPFDGERALTEGELLLGFVADRKKGEEKEEIVRALASRVRFSPGVLVENGQPALLPPVKLRVLDGPKTPCPSLYFKPKGAADGGFIAKGDLNPKAHTAQGRKFYLHHAKGEPWKSVSGEANEKQQSIVEPMAAGRELYFHVDFDNLSGEELGLLLYALSPSEEFQHKIGMGKPIGLGSIRVEPLGYFRVDRQRRYTREELGGARYHEAYPAAAGAKARLPPQYGAEAAALERPASETWTMFRDRFRAAMPAQIRQAIALVGEPRHLKAPVMPPMLADQKDPEAETFRWFVANETGIVENDLDREIGAQKQYLRPLVNRQDLPVFSQPGWTPRRKRW